MPSFLPRKRKWQASVSRHNCNGQKQETVCAERLSPGPLFISPAPISFGNTRESRGAGGLSYTLQFTELL